MVSFPTRSNGSATEGVEFVFREVRTAHEMRQVLALRYRTYQGADGLSHFDSLDAASRLDAESFDITARHFALIGRSGCRESVVGSMRLVTGRPSPQLHLLHACGAAHPTLAARLLDPRPGSLPLLEWLDRAPTIAAWLNGLREEREHVIEAGRFAIEPRVLVGTGRTGLRLSHHAVLSTIAVAIEQERVDRVVVFAEPVRARLYSSFGFAPVACAPTASGARCGSEYVVLHATPAMVPAGVVPLVAERAEQLRRTGEAVLRREAPGLPTRSERLRNAAAPAVRPELVASAA